MSIQALISEFNLDFEEVKPNIFIPSEKEGRLLNRDVKILFSAVEANPIGRRLLEKIQLCATEIYILYGHKDYTSWIHDRENKKDSLIQPVVISLSMKDTQCFSMKGEAIPLPKHVILFHELTHAYHNLSGKRATSRFCDPLVWETDEEYKTIVGFPSKKGKTAPKITENAFRLAEGLPERFGSWGPSSDNEELTFNQALCLARIKVLGNIHERNKLMSPQSSSPPPMARCSMDDLGSRTRCAFLAVIQGVEIDFTPKDTTSRFFSIDPSNLLEPMMGEECYLSLPATADVPPEDLRKTMIALFPKLNAIDFKVKSFFLLRFSQQEIEIMLGNTQPQSI